MSSGGILVAPLAIPVIVAAGAVVVVGGAAVLMVRAAGAATAFAAAGVVRLADAMEQASREQLDVQRSARLWEIAAAEVVSLNARIRVLGAAARRGGVAVDLPGPMDPSCYDLCQIRDWCVATEVGLRGVRANLDAAAAGRERERVHRTSVDRPSAAAVLARHEELLRERLALEAATTGVPPTTVDDLAGVEEKVLWWRGRLDREAGLDECDRVSEAAVNVVTQTDLGTAETYLLELQDRVEQINARVARRRLAATWLGALEHPAVVAEPNPPFPSLVQRLQAVVDGDAELTADIAREAAISLRWAEGVVDRAFLQETVQDCLARLGYRVDSTMDVTHTDGLRVVRSDWGTGHVADLWFADGAIKGRLVRQEGATDAEAAALDHERCEDFADDLGSLAEALAQRGLAAVPTVHVGGLVQRAETDRIVETAAGTRPAAKQRETR